MDDHYDLDDACEPTSPGEKDTYLINPGKRLEEWTNTRNTKNQYNKQLRNFLKVSIPTG